MNDILIAKEKLKLEIGIVEEKLELARKLGMSETIQKKLQSNLDVARLTDLKVNKITELQIRNKLLQHKKYSFKFTEGISPLTCFLIFLTMVASVTGAIRIYSFGNSFREVLPFVTVLAYVPLLLSFVSNMFRNIIIRSMPLKDWKHEIPYGALLAVDEVSKKLTNKFIIYYPALENIKYNFKRGRWISAPDVVRKNDPVIVGILNDDTMVEVFSWDDNIVYEEDKIISI